MEHRWSRRKPLDMCVTLYCAGADPQQGRVRDVSLEGMFVEIPGPVPVKNTLVELSFRLKNGSTGKDYRLRSYVVHSESAGVGLMFMDFRIDAFRYFQDLLYAA